MNPLSPPIAIGVCVALGIVGSFLMAGSGIFIARKLKARNAGKPSVLPGLFGSASNALNSPLVKEFEKILVQAVHDSQHAALNAGVAALFPPLKPFIPAIDQLADGVLAKVTGAPLPAPAVVIPPGHPVLELLQKMLEAGVQQQKAKAA